MSITGLFTDEYKKIKVFWVSGFRYSVYRTGVAFFALMLLSFAVCLLFPTLHKRILAEIASYFAGVDITDGTGHLSAIGLLRNNLTSCALTILYGLIPFVYFSALSLGINSMILGVIATYFVAVKHDILTYVLGIAPHGIFELPAIILSVALGLYLCSQVTRRIRRDQTATPVLECLNECSRVFLLVITPLLILASLIEAYITPYLAG